MSLFFERPAWFDNAACRDKPTGWFFPQRGSNTRKAQETCETCPVLDICDQFATLTGEEGFWAGRMRGPNGKDSYAALASTNSDPGDQDPGDAVGTRVDRPLRIESGVSDPADADTSASDLTDMVA